MYELCKMVVKTNKIIELFVSHINLKFNEKDHVLVG